MNTDALYQQSREAAAHRFWVFSDLQQSDTEIAEECMAFAMNDIQTLGPDFTQLWYLGDATEGKDHERTLRMTEMQIEQFGSLNVPLRFVMGNHDLDETRDRTPDIAPLLTTYEAFKGVPGWRSTDTPQDFFFTETYGNLLVVFLSDHICPNNRWVATQQELRGKFPEEYSVPLVAHQHLRQTMADWPGPVIIAGHYAFPGGARGTPEGSPQERLLPLPHNVKLVLHGHAHLGDWTWGKSKACHRMSHIDWHEVPQANISSLDRRRGYQTHSAVLHVHDNGTLALFFRDHEDARWSDVFITDSTAPRTPSDRSIESHREKNSLEGTPLERWQQQHP